MPSESPAAATSRDSASSAVSARNESALILVHGTVLDEQGQPVASAGIRWIDEFGIKAAADVQAGAYSIPGLRPGRYFVDVGGTGWRRRQFEALLTSEPAVQTQDVRLAASIQVPVRVVPTDGVALFGEESSGLGRSGNRLRIWVSSVPVGRELRPEIAINPQASDRARFHKHLGSEGERAECFGMLEILADPPMYVSLALGSSVLGTERIESIPSEIVFRVRAAEIEARTCSVRLRILTGERREPARAGVAILQGDVLQTSSPDAEGRVSFADLTPGNYILTLSVPGSERPRIPLVVRGGEALDLGDVFLGARQEQQFRFRSPESLEGAEEVRFSLQRIEPDVSPSVMEIESPSSYAAQSGGPTSIPFPGPGNYLLRVWQRARAAGPPVPLVGARPARITLGDAPAGEIVVALERSTAICLRPSHAAGPVSRWLVCTPEGLPCRRVLIEGRAPTRIELVPGPYTIARIDPQTETLGKPQPFTVGSEFLALELDP